MKRTDKIDLFMNGTRKAMWTKDKIDEFMEAAEKEFDDAMRELGGGGNVTGYRSETINGETTEYQLVDGEWEEIGPSSHEVSFDLEEEDGGYTMTMDISAFLPFGDYEASASLNNGVLEIYFE